MPRPRPAATPLTAAPVVIALLAAALLAVAGCQDGAAPRVGSTTSADGTSIAYTVAGEGPDVVLVHCWLGDQSFYAETLADLARDHRVVALDLAGHGRSGKDRTDYTMAAFARDVLAVMDAERIGRAVIVGHSMGGTVALALAEAAPGRVDGIVGIDNLHQVDRGITDEQLAQFMAPMREDFATAVAGFVGGMFPAGTDSAVVARAVGPMASAPPQIGLSAFEHLIRFDLATAARAYGRTLHLVNDAARPVDAAQWQEQGVEVRVAALEGVGHFPMFTAPERFLPRLREAVADAVAAGAAER